MVGANEWGGAGGILVNGVERWGKGDLVVIYIALGTMQLMMSNCKKIAVEGTD